MADTRKVSGRGGWKTIKWCPRGERELNKREQTEYERYCAYCELLECPPAPDYIWYVVSQSLKSY